MDKKNKEILSSSGESDDEVDEIEIKKKNIKVQRSSVSAECFGTFNKKSDFKPREIQKSHEVQLQIAKRLSQAFMFSALDKQEQQIVIGAMEERNYQTGDWVIKQGEEGDVLYVVESGKLDCSKLYSDKTEPTYLKTYEPGESFGELALLYNAPRAASIQAKTDCKLFALDRQTFNHIVKDAQMRKREQYEKFLLQWDLLKSIDDNYEKISIGDALVSKNFKKGDVVIEKGDSNKDIFILMSGSVSAQDGQNKDIITFDKQGDYFGEIPSIFKGKPQPFNFVASSDEVIGVFIPSSSYKTTLKIVENELVQNASKYSNFL